MDLVVNRFTIWLVELDPSRGSEIAKTRPCVVISPDATNHYLNTVLIAPFTSTRKSYPTRVNISFQSRNGQIALDQLRSVDKIRLIKKLGTLDPVICEEVSRVLTALFQF